MDMEQFLSRHNIDNETFERLVEESSDYDLPPKLPISFSNMTIDQFIDNLEEIYECKGEGYIKCLQKIKDEKGRENTLWYEIEKLKKENEKLKRHVLIANEYCESRGYKWDEKDEVYVYDRLIRI